MQLNICLCDRCSFSGLCCQHKIITRLFQLIALLVRDPLTGKVGVIFMELTDGMALERCLNGERPVRPDTSSLLAHFLSAMECRVRLVLINGRKDEVF